MFGVRRKVLLMSEWRTTVMKTRIAIFATMALTATLVWRPMNVHAQQPPAAAAQHEHQQSDKTEPPAVAGEHHMMNMGMDMNVMARMKTADAKLDALVKKMNEAKGAAKTDAIAELLTALVNEHRTVGEPMMANMMSMMTMMSACGGMGGNESGTPEQK
jgi:hypothetical protein